MMKKILFALKLVEVRLRFIGILVAMVLIVGYWDRISTGWDRLTRPSRAPAIAGDKEFFCPMHPQVVRDQQGNCPICGMSLSERKKGEKEVLPEGVVGRVTLSPLRVQMAGITTVEVGYRPLFRTIETTGDLETDERRRSRIVARTAGRADKVYADYAGAEVKAGAPLLEIYSPDLLTGREEYVNALQWLGEAKTADAEARAKRLVRSARERLLLWGMTEAQVDALKPGVEVEPHVDVVSPISGTVTAKLVVAGQEVAAGDVLYEVADLSVLWLQVHVLEDDLGLVKTGLTVDVTAVAFPGESFGGTVTFVDPLVDARTRTGRARVDVPNPDGKLRPGMAVTARVAIPVAPRYETFVGCCPDCPEVLSDKPGKCPGCGMNMVPQGPVVVPLAKPVYRCWMEGGERDTPGPCPKCGMQLGEKDLVKPDPAGTRTVWVCEVHPDHVHDDPAQGEACAGGPDQPRKIEPGSRLVYACPMHPDQTSDKPGKCPICGMALVYRIESRPTRLAEHYGCPVHPSEFSDLPGKCRVCATPFEKVKVPEVLAVPFLSVVDSGSRKVVWVDKGGGLFEGVEVRLGARAGEYYPVLKGLAAGQRVAAAGAFLIDAENGLNPSAASAYFGASGSPSGDGK